MPNVGAVTVTFPNRAAAICLANRSHAMLLQGRLQEAQLDAEAAVQACPEYVKAHRRCVEVLRKLGKKNEAAEIEKTVSGYEILSAQLPWYGAALLAADWISDEDHILVYQQYWQQHCFQKAKKAGATNAGEQVNATASLVNFMDGQWFMCGFKYMSQNFDHIALDCIDFVNVDPENGLDLERPPHGHPSQQSLRHVPSLFRKFLKELKGNGFRVQSLMLGQGLTDSIESVRPAVDESYPGIFIYPAFSTGASEAEAERVLGLPEYSLS